MSKCETVVIPAEVVSALEKIPEGIIQAALCIKPRDEAVRIKWRANRKRETRHLSISVLGHLVYFVDQDYPDDSGNPPPVSIKRSEAEAFLKYFEPKK